MSDLKKLDKDLFSLSPRATWKAWLLAACKQI